MQRDQEWTCTPCPKDKFGRASNFADRNTCRKCGKARPPQQPQQPQQQPLKKTTTEVHERKGVTFKPGDWFCAACDDHQFRDNKFCRKCNASKPLSNDDVSGTECVVCFAHEKNTGFLHGGEVHLCCCRECATKLKICPICRAKVETTVTVFC